MNPTTLYAAIGGVTIGLAAVLLYAGLGRVAGISGIFNTALQAPRQQGWATLFVVGLGIGGWLAWSLGLWDPGAGASSTPAQDATYPYGLGSLLVGGLLVGFGTRMGSGCTSGHGVCGSARLSMRSIAATATFVLVGMITATLIHGATRS